MTNPKIIVTDRYGGNHPNPDTVCLGPCEGMGCIPVFMSEPDPELARLWQEAEANESAKDGVHFVTCPSCGGSGERK